MKVRELIALLVEQDPEHTVVIPARYRGRGVPQPVSNVGVLTVDQQHFLDPEGDGHIAIYTYAPDPSMPSEESTRVVILDTDGSHERLDVDVWETLPNPFNPPAC